MSTSSEFQSAIAALRAREWATLHSLALSLLSGHSQNADVQFLLGVALHGLRDFNGAALHLAESARLNPSHTAALAYQCDALRELGQWRQALECVQRALQQMPDHDIALCHYALLLCQIPGASPGDLSQARALAAKAMQQIPDSPRHAYVLAYACLRCGDAKSASAVLSELLRIQPENADALALSALLPDLSARDAVRRLDQAMLLAPDRAEWHINLARFLFAEGRAEEAEASADRGLALKPFLSLGHYIKGLCHASQRRFADAAESFRAACQYNPCDAKSVAALGDALRQAGLLYQAERTLMSALNAFPRDAGVLGNLAAVLQQKGDAEGAAELYRRLLEFEPRSLIALNNLGRIHLDRLEYGEAEQSLRMAFECAPAVVREPIVANLARALMQLGRSDEAERLLLAGDGQPLFQGAEPQLALLDLRENQDRLPEARELCERLRSAFPQDASVLIRWARLQVSLGQEAAALEALERAEASSGEARRLKRSRVRILSEAGEHAAAVALATVAEGVDGATPSDYIEWAGACEAAGDEALAQTALSAGRARFPTDFELASAVLSHCIRHERWQAFDSAAAATLGTFPDRAAVFGLVANGLQARLQTLRAIEVVRRGLERFPLDFGLCRQLAGLLLHEHQNVEALTLARQWAAESPMVRFRELLIDVCESCGEYAEGVALARELIEAQPTRSWAHRTLARLLQLSGDEAGAIITLKAGLEAQPADAGLRAALMAMLLSCERVSEAEALAKAERARRPDDPEAHQLLVRVLVAAERFDDAESVARRIYRRFPGNPAAVSPLYRLLMRQERHADARHLLEEAIKVAANPLAIRLVLIDHYAKLGDYQRAAADCLVLVEEKGWLSRYAFRLFDLYLEAREFAKAEGVMREVLRLRPRHPAAYGCLGRLYSKMRFWRKTEEVLRKAIREQPMNAQHYVDLLRALADRGDFTEYTALYRKAMALLGDAQYKMLPSYFFSLNCHPDLSAEEIFAEYQKWATHFLDRQPRPAFAYDHAPLKARRLRVGYVSPDFRRHAVAKFAMPLLSQHDRGSFELFAYSHLESGQADDVTEDFKTCFDHWCDVTHMSTEELVRRIRHDRIDVLVDLAGHTSNHKLAAFHMKPAPIQASFVFGAGQTTGMPAVDFLIGDAICLPPDHRHCYSEQVIELPCAFAFQAPVTPAVSALPALHAGVLTFGCLSRSIRISHPVIRAWAQILLEVPGSRLLLDAQPYSEAEMCDWLAEQFQQHGVARDRLLFRHSKSYWDIFADVDILLDPFPAGSGTILTEGLWMGVPSIALHSRPPMGRIGETMLEALGLRDWVAQDTDAYVQIAKNKAADPEALSALRASLRERFLASPLSDHSGYARHVEVAYRRVWEEWAARARSGGAR